VRQGREAGANRGAVHPHARAPQNPERCARGASLFFFLSPQQTRNKLAFIVLVVLPPALAPTASRARMKALANMVGECKKRRRAS